MYAAESGDAVLVGGVADGAPADLAGLEAGDQILAVGDTEIDDLGDLWRRIWACGAAGVEVPMRVVRDDRPFDVLVQSADRTAFLKSPKRH